MIAGARRWRCRVVAMTASLMMAVHRCRMVVPVVRVVRARGGRNVVVLWPMCCMYHAQWIVVMAVVRAACAEHHVAE